MTWILIADDLSGACETGSAINEVLNIAAKPLRSYLAVELFSPGRSPHFQSISLIDLNIRDCPAGQAEEIFSDFSQVLDTKKSETYHFYKVDSLLRGNLPMQVSLLGQKSPLILIPAVPTLNRAVHNGEIHVNGVSLRESNLWKDEVRGAPQKIGELFPGKGVIYSESRGLQEIEELLRSLKVGEIFIPDIKTSQELREIAGLLPQFPGVIPLGSAEFATAHFNAIRGNQIFEGHDLSPLPIKSATVVVGSNSTMSLAQLAYLQGESHTPVSTADVVVKVSQGEDLSPLHGADIHSRALFISGGTTARRFLDSARVSSLQMLNSLEYGVALGISSDNQLIAIKPGSFGNEGTISKSLRVMLEISTLPNRNQMKTLDSNLPIVAITMGDAAGVGPEVIAGALINQEVQGFCRPVVIGDVKRLRSAAEILDLPITFHSVSNISECRFISMAIDVIDPELIPEDLAWGALSPEAGHAAYEYVRIASELALAGSVQAICTAPLNKEALRMGGHDFPGHTELLSFLCNIPEVSMMLSTAKLNVIHVTTHIGLIDAVNKIEKGLVARTILRGHEALLRAGIANPKIGVCGINPHAGEHGMFGYGEEEEKIEPAIIAVREQGVDVEGPLPADSLFFRAGRGDFDLVVAMYHDQGHAPIKLLGMEAGVNVTVGLPVIRTSVDHGTAFDIAGTGKADESSMIEALRLAAAMASRS